MPAWQTEHARWWVMRRASNHQPKTYRCPICGQQLPALSEHMLLFPEGDHSRRRHAHTRCVLAARSNGELLTREEWVATQPHPGKEHAGKEHAGKEHPGKEHAGKTDAGLTGSGRRGANQAAGYPSGQIPWWRPSRWLRR
jgi:hypothetical protein